MNTLYPHQESARALISARFAAGTRAFLLADEVGLGKTRVACAVAAHTGGRVIVVAPLSTFGGWLQEAATVGFQLGTDPCSAGGWLINYERLQAVHTGRFQLVIWDESHRLKSYRAKRHAQFLRIRKSAFHLLFLSATPAQSPLEMKYLGDVLEKFDPDPGPQYWSWVRTWTGVRVNQWNGLEFVPTAEDLARLTQIFSSPLVLRRTPADVKGWPSLQRQCVPIVLTPNQWDEYRRAYADYVSEIRRLGRSAPSVAAAMVAVGQFRKRLSVLKAPAAIELAGDLVEQRRVVVISPEYLDSAKMIRNGLDCDGRRVAYLDGSTPDTDRRVILERSARDEYDVIVTTLMEGVNLHQCEASHRPRAHVIVDPRWSAIQQHQLEGRVHRAGRRALVSWLVCADTVDDRVARKLAARLECMTALTEGAEREMIENILNEGLTNSTFVCSIKNQQLELPL